MSKRAIIWCAVSTIAQANEDDKFSMEAQEADARRVAAELGLVVVDVMRVEGHSRDYKSLEKLAADARRRGIDAFDKLIAHLEAKDYEVFICRDANRFARSAALLHYIVETIIDSNRQIYTLADGWIDKRSSNIWAAFKGYETNHQMEWLREARARGMEKRLQGGIPFFTVAPAFVEVRRDAGNGKITSLHVNEGLRRLYSDLATLILNGESWEAMEHRLYELYGHVDPKTGQPWTGGTMRTFVSSPLWWGHGASGHQRQGKRRVKVFGPWLWSDDYPAPEGVSVVRNVITPVWDGELAESVQQELIRRFDIGSRSQTVEARNKFTSLLVCKECGYYLGSISKKRPHGSTYYYGMRCSSAYSVRRKQLGVDCSNHNQISVRRIQDYIDKLFRAYAAGEDPEIFSTTPQSLSNDREMVPQVEQELTDAKQAVQRLIREQSLASDEVQNFYREEIQALGKRVQVLTERLTILRREAVKAANQGKKQSEAIRTIVEQIDEFWTWDATEINQMLHAAFLDKRLVSYGGEIVGVTDLSEVKARRRFH